MSASQSAPMTSRKRYVSAMTAGTATTNVRTTSTGARRPTCAQASTKVSPETSRAAAP